MSNSRLFSMAIAALVSLAGCGGGGDSAAQNDPYPLAVGNTWTYELKNESSTFPTGDTSTYTYTLTDASKSGSGVTVYSASATPTPFQPPLPDNLSRSTDEITTRSVLLTTPVSRVVLKFPVTVGEKWESHLDFPIGVDQFLRVDTVTQVLPNEIVETALGPYFAFVVSYRREFRYVSQPNGGYEQLTEYFAPGVGLIKRVARSKPIGFSRGERGYTMTLLALTLHQ